MELDIRQLDTKDNGFDEDLTQLLVRGLEFTPEIDRAVSEIISRVRTEGDSALLEYTRKFDGNNVEKMSDLVLGTDAMDAAAGRMEKLLATALMTAKLRIKEFHEHQVEETWVYKENVVGSKLGQKVTPIEKVGIYVPGGTAAYPSTVLMTAIPAVIAGVSEIVMVVPAPDGRIPNSVLAAASIAGVSRVFAIGGAQAIAALAFGTQTVPKVDKIVGPGNAWVSSAKRQVFGHVGIDLVAGPSEVVVVCDDSTNAEWAAMDMFAQAEHDEKAQSILLSLSSKKLKEIHEYMLEIFPKLPRNSIIQRSLEDNGALIHVHDKDRLVEIIDRIAPEHLELMIEDAVNVGMDVRNAGAIFIGPESAEVIGDYCAGPSHVLPTSGSARFSSPLGVYDFTKRSSIIQMSRTGAQHLGRVSSLIAREERLYAHALSAQCRV